MPFREHTTRLPTELLRYSLGPAAARATRLLVGGAVVLAFAVLYWIADRGVLECRTADVGYDCAVAEVFGPIPIGGEDYRGVCNVGRESIGTGKGRHQAVLLYPCAGGNGLVAFDDANDDELDRLGEQMTFGDTGRLQAVHIRSSPAMTFAIGMVGLIFLGLGSHALRRLEGTYVLEVDAAETVITVRRERPAGKPAATTAPLHRDLRVERVVHTGRHSVSHALFLVVGTERLELSPPIAIDEGAALEAAVTAALTRLRRA